MFGGKFIKNNFKVFSFPLYWKAGRDNVGRISSFSKGNRYSKKRHCFFNYSALGVPSSNYVVKLVYDFCRNPYLVLIYSIEFGFRLMISPVGLNFNSTLMHFSSEFSTGGLNYISYIPLNSKIYNVDFMYGRSSGSSSIVVSQSKNFSMIKLSSGSIKKFFGGSVAFFGTPSFGPKFFRQYSKAGHHRALFGSKPRVRGVAKNPVDHPHGGGEGRKSPPRSPRSPWGWLTKSFSSVRRMKKKKKKGNV